MVSNELVSLLAPGGSAGLLATELPWVTLVAVLMAGKCYWLVYYVSMLMVYHATLYHHGMPYVASWLLYVMSFISVCCLVANPDGSLRAKEPLSHVARIQTREVKWLLETQKKYGVFEVFEDNMCITIPCLSGHGGCRSTSGHLAVFIVKM